MEIIVPLVPPSSPSQQPLFAAIVAVSSIMPLFLQVRSEIILNRSQSYNRFQSAKGHEIPSRRRYAEGFFKGELHVKNLFLVSTKNLSLCLHFWPQSPTLAPCHHYTELRIFRSMRVHHYLFLFTWAQLRPKLCPLLIAHYSMDQTESNSVTTTKTGRKIITRQLPPESVKDRNDKNYSQLPMTTTPNWYLISSAMMCY